MSEAVGARIRARRKELGLSQDSVAEAVGVTGGAVSQWELGLVDVLGKNLVKLALVLDTTPEWLLGESESTRSSGLDACRLERALMALESLSKSELASLSAGQRAKLLAYLYGRDPADLSAVDVRELLVLVR